jgi:endonuclease/exonuclease/phosphatase family metal-dependent hydrolase
VAEARRASDETAAAELPPVIVNRPARGAADTLRVVAFNARWGLRLYDIIERLRRPPLTGADLIFLSEIDCNVRRSSNRDVAAEIAGALGMSFAYVPEFAPRSQASNPVSFLGNAIVSSQPITGIKTVALPNFRPPRSVRLMIGGPRGMAAAINFCGRQITAGIAHFHSRTAPAGRELQMARFLEGLPAAGPAIVGGDFNSTTIELRGARGMIMAMMQLALTPRRFRMPMRYEPLFAQLAEKNFRIEGANAMGKPTFTFSGAVPRWARPKLDWIALRELEPVEGSAAVVPAKTSLFGRRISDHDFITCKVRV